MTIAAPVQMFLVVPTLSGTAPEIVGCSQSLLERGSGHSAQNYHQTGLGSAEVLASASQLAALIIEEEIIAIEDKGK